MPIAHICRQCGQGLGRIRPQRDPHYGLSLVTCPVCGWSCVRRKSPASVAWHTFLRRSRVSSLIVAKVSISLLLLLFMTATIGSIHSGEFSFSRADRFRGYWLILSILLILQPVTVGTWLTWAFNHLPRWKVFATWGGLIAIILVIVGIVQGITGELDGFSRTELRSTSIPMLALMGMNQVLPISLGLLAMMMVFALGGIPMGKLVLAAMQVIDRRRFRWMLRRRRLRRSLE